MEVQIPWRIRKRLGWGPWLILTRMGKTGVEGYVTFWHWWSSYAHSFPMSYYRMSEQSRGHGIQNDHDILYISGSLEVPIELVNDSLGGMRKLLPKHRNTRRVSERRSRERAPRKNIPGIRRKSTVQTLLYKPSRFGRL